MEAAVEIINKEVEIINKSRKNEKKKQKKIHMEKVTNEINYIEIFFSILMKNT